VWVECLGQFGWCLVTDYGKPGDVCVVTSARTRDNCIAALADYVRDYGDAWKGYDLRVEEWESFSVKLDAWITSTQKLGLKWAPFPG
jgi:hypothetical protein